MKNINWYPPSRPSLGRYSSIALSRSLQTSTATVWGRPSTISPNLCYKNIKTSFHNHVLFWLCFLIFDNSIPYIWFHKICIYEEDEEHFLFASVIFCYLQKFLKENHMGFNFCILNNLWCKSDHQKS